MHYPTLSNTSKSYQIIERFGGYCHRESAGDGEFFHMENLSGDHYPHLAPRESRKTVAEISENAVLLAKDVLCYPERSGLTVGGSYVELNLLPYHTIKLLSMGAYILVLTKDAYGNDLDKKWLSTADLSQHGSIEAHFTARGPVTVSLCKSSGEDYPTPVASPEKPESPVPGDLWLDTAAQPPVLYCFSALDDWVCDSATCLRIDSPGIGLPFSVGDGVHLQGFAASALDGTHVIRAIGEDFIVIDGIVDKPSTFTDAVTVSRTMPKMDYLTESGNRLWGCRYGPCDSGEFVNEIYCSRLGDFKNWSCFEGISTDSYRAGVGSDGAFTAAVTFMGMPHFFKENRLYKVYGSYPSAFRIQESTLPGVQKGCADSAVAVGDVLCYKGKAGVFAYDGALPSLLSRPLGNTPFYSAAAGSLGDKYYISMQDKKGGWHLFVYDFLTGLWHREDASEVSSFACLDGKMYFLDKRTGQIKVMAEGTETVNWVAQSPPMGAFSPEESSISKITLRLKLPVGSALSVFIRYDGVGSYLHLGTFYGSADSLMTLPIVPRRCSKFSLRLCGKGDFRLYSMTKVTEKRGQL